MVEVTFGLASTVVVGNLEFLSSCLLLCLAVAVACSSLPLTLKSVLEFLPVTVMLVYHFAFRPSFHHKKKQLLAFRPTHRVTWGFST
ncbi:hypothetical protein SADUNF_Sadunf03G0004000 [Salix dunnii]|uniref:Uncharacterized protein n=1 Tax=Salix dunnii TaxID=1413687 RepID=A0A835K908_9ROSI|nr:hypothetical protein SADUNF_Sadunf03G0004000 [Salix dunnii]